MSIRPPYKSDLTDAQWLIIEPFMPPPASTGRPREHSLREVLNTIFYQLKTGCQWDMLPHDLVPASTTRDWFVRFERDGTWEKIQQHLRVQERLQAGRE